MKTEECRGEYVKVVSVVERWKWWKIVFHKDDTINCKQKTKVKMFSEAEWFRNLFCFRTRVSPIRREADKNAHLTLERLRTKCEGFFNSETRAERLNLKAESWTFSEAYFIVHEKKLLFFYGILFVSKVQSKSVRRKSSWEKLFLSFFSSTRREQKEGRKSVKQFWKVSIFSLLLMMWVLCFHKRFIDSRDEMSARVK